MSNRRHFLVGMLYHGENERPIALAELQRQAGCTWDLFSIEYMANKPAHDMLYARFMAGATGYDYFLKLDADMVLLHERALQEIAGAFEANPGVDVFMFDLLDWYSDGLIPGLYAFRSSVRWLHNPDLLMVDHAPASKGQQVRISASPAPLARHSPDPSPLQAFRFGLHRGLKMVQSDRPFENRDVRRFEIQFEIANRCWNEFRNSGDRRRGLVAAGIDAAIRPSGPAPLAYMDRAFDAMFEERYAALDAAALRERLESNWNDENANWERLMQVFIAGSPSLPPS